MRFLDTDVMIDILRGYPPALAWLATLGNEEIALCGIVVMELLQGCKDQNTMTKTEKFLESYRIYWPTAADCHRALNDLANRHLSHGLKMLDALIGECAVGLGVPLFTFNKKHFDPISALKTLAPYAKQQPTLPPANP